MISVCDRVENIGEKGENASHQHFLLFPQCFPKAVCVNVVKIGLYGRVQESLHSIHQASETLEGSRFV